MRTRTMMFPIDLYGQTVIVQLTFSSPKEAIEFRKRMPVDETVGRECVEWLAEGLSTEFAPMLRLMLPGLNGWSIRERPVAKKPEPRSFIDECEQEGVQFVEEAAMAARNLSKDWSDVTKQVVRRMGSFFGD